METAPYLLALAGLALAVPLAGQTASGAGNFGDDSSIWVNDGACDDTRFVGDRGAGAWTSNDDHVGRDATDCRNLLNAGRIRWGRGNRRRAVGWPRDQPRRSGRVDPDA